jgi:2-dehydro-3-deoxyphosphogluconate aldolase/(4S)-4-hydroxy-2-oxoglutarate aldolase
MEIMAKLGKMGVVPVVKIEQADQAPALAQALCNGGLPCAEITFRTDAAEEAIHQITASHPEMAVGAGTVLSIAQAEKAVNAGAQFIVSPGFDPNVVDWCLMRDVAIIPGVATSTEALMALDKGLHVLKFFPAEELGGISMLQAMSAALIGVKFLPTGGITPVNMAAYLRLPMVFAVAGSWIATAKMISAGDFEGISRLAGDAVNAVRRERQTGEGSWPAG